MAKKDDANNMVKKIRKGDPAPVGPWKFWKQTTEGGQIYYYFKLTRDVDTDHNHYRRT